jgi:hypothetical protein
VTATVHVPAGLAAAANGEAACCRGAEGATDRCTTSRVTTDAQTNAQTDDGAIWQAVSGGAPGAGQTMTVAVGIASGTFTVPMAPPRAWWATWLPLGTSAAAFVADLGLYAFTLRRSQPLARAGALAREHIEGLRMHGAGRG